jgi:hypothetical protein
MNRAARPLWDSPHLLNLLAGNRKPNDGIKDRERAVHPARCYELLMRLYNIIMRTDSNFNMRTVTPKKVKFKFKCPFYSVVNFEFTLHFILTVATTIALAFYVKS